jgi:hypothetical protein
MMTRPVVLIAMLLVLVSCASDPKSIPLGDVDLSDMSTVQEIRSRLDAKEGVAFANYVVKHISTSSSFCGNLLLGPKGKPPSTIGEAIEFTLAKDAEDRRASQMAIKLKPYWELEQKKNQLANQRDLLVDMQGILRAEHGAGAVRLSRWRSIETSLAEVNRRLAELKTKSNAGLYKSAD